MRTVKPHTNLIQRWQTVGGRTVVQVEHERLPIALGWVDGNQLDLQFVPFVVGERPVERERTEPSSKWTLDYRSERKEMGKIRVVRHIDLN